MTYRRPYSKAPPPDRPTLKFLDEWVIPIRGNELDKLASSIKEEVERTQQRRRARKLNDERAFDHAVRSAVANLARAVIEPPAEGVLATKFISGRDRRSTRYDCSAFGKPWKTLTESFELLGLITLTSGSAPTNGYRGQAPSLRPTDEFAGRVLALPMEELQVERHRDEEVLILSETKWSEGDKLKRLIDYPETPETTALRLRVAELNAFLSRGVVEFVKPCETIRYLHPVDRSLRRRFMFREGDDEAAPVFQRGGRLYGGEWQTMKRADRKYLRINGEAIAELDYSAMNAHLAYARMGLTPPSCDLYRIPGLEGYRADVKMLFNAMLSMPSGYKVNGWPRSMQEASEGLQEDDGHDVELPAGALVRSGMPVKMAMNAIADHHRAIAGQFRSGAVDAIQHVESETMLAVLERLRAIDIMALPIHDAVLVSQSSVIKAEQAMREAAKRGAGIDIPVAVKGR